MKITKCEYELTIPTVGLCCGAYSKSKRPDGLHWGHYPFCEDKNCPLKNPELLDGAVLKGEPLLDKFDLSKEFKKRGYTFEEFLSILLLVKTCKKFEDDNIKIEAVTVANSTYYRLERKEDK